MNPSDPNPHKRHRGLARIVRATGHSARGLSAAWRHESAFRQEAALAAVLVPAAFWLGRGWEQIALLGGAALLVLVVELLNSALEAVVDRISLEHHPLAGRAKDYGSAAVFVALVLCAAVWAAALWQRLVG